MKENGTSTNSSNYEKIAQRAYELWEKSGRPEGKETEHWFRAEQEVINGQLKRGSMTGTSQKESDARRALAT